MHRDRLFLLPLLICFQVVFKTSSGAAQAVAPQKGLVRCCDHSPNVRCRGHCRALLTEPPSPEDQDQILNKLVASGCGAPLPSERLWQCFLRASHQQLRIQKETSSDILPSPNYASLEQGQDLLTSIDSRYPDSEFLVLPLDLARAHCCNRARTLECHQLCHKTFGREWTSVWMEFDRHCQYNREEHELWQCLEHVGEPCELGCTGLGFCQTFNGRPIELFGSCNEQSDSAAKHDASLLLSPFGEREDFFFPSPIGRFLKPNTTLQCPHKLWSVVACILQIKPCHTVNHHNRICRSDCLSLVTSCLEEGADEDLCRALSPPDGDPCISLERFLPEGKGLTEREHVKKGELHQPCRGQPCSNGEICLVRGKGFLCSQGCRLGEMSRNVVSLNTWLLVPQPSPTVGCHRPCQCSQSHLSATACGSSRYKCKPMAPCLNEDQNNTQRYVHGSYFSSGCKSCFCFDGEVTCWNNSCASSHLEEISIESVSTCVCPSHYVPVCGLNGKTYSNTCYARCAGLTRSQYEPGHCKSVNPCATSPCPGSQTCIPKRRTCLAWEVTGCPQYQCVECRRWQELSLSPVCDIDGQHHNNICLMLKSNRSLAYEGFCRKDCNSEELVCGINGEEYENECSAWNDFSIVDYEGPCRAYPASSTLKCLHVVCQPLPSKFCHKIFIREACCPVCGGGVLSMAYSPRILNHHLKDTKDTSDAVTITSLASQLSQRISFSECRLSAQLNAKRTRVIVVVTVSVRIPSSLQVRACALEAQKIRTLLEQQNPVLTLQLPLAAITGVDFLAPSIENFTSRTTFSVILIICALGGVWLL